MVGQKRAPGSLSPMREQSGGGVVAASCMGNDEPCGPTTTPELRKTPFRCRAHAELLFQSSNVASHPGLSRLRLFQVMSHI